VATPPAIVLLHGFTQTGASWRATRERLGERYRALAPDIRGHGKAARRLPADFTSCLADLSAQAPERFVLAGYSMGGRLALHFALAHPERVEHLVLVSAGPGIADPLERDARREADAALAGEIEESDVESFARRWARQPILKGQPAEVAAEAHRDRLRNTPAGLAAGLRGLGQGTMEPLWARLGELAMPVTLVAGEHDAKYVKIAQRVAELIPTSRLLVVPHVGHAVHLEAPGIVATCLEEATASNPAPRC
jgi:2-succinyl-6-hydroxy-2,4-cyclohexadiene-1-carboxylate synthase